MLSNTSYDLKISWHITIQSKLIDSTIEVFGLFICFIAKTYACIEFAEAIQKGFRYIVVKPDNGN